MLLRCITALKKNVCCGEIIPTNVNFQLYGTGNRSKWRPPPRTPNYARLIGNLLPFWWFHYCPFCSRRTPRFVAWVLLQLALFVSSVLHVSPHEAVTESETWWPHWPGVYTKTGIRYDGLAFARGGGKPKLAMIEYSRASWNSTALVAT